MLVNLGAGQKVVGSPLGLAVCRQVPGAAESLPMQRPFHTRHPGSCADGVTLAAGLWAVWLGSLASAPQKCGAYWDR